MTRLLDCRDVVKHFPIHRSNDKVQAVNGVSFSVQSGETLGLVGESGSGKTTIGKLILGLLEPTAGEILFEGERIGGLSPGDFRRYRPKIQAVFQDPYDSLDPRKRVRDVILEPLERMGLYGSVEGRRRRLGEAVDLVGLHRGLLDRFPHELSGGQQQKVGVARALASNPAFLVLDEPTSALSPAARGELIDLLDDLQRQLGITYLFITHDLKVIETIAHNVAVMYLGRIVETGPVRDIFARPAHPYTQALLGSVLAPRPGRSRLRVLQGEIPSPIHLPSGCAFASRCRLAEERCTRILPPLDPVPGLAQAVACIRSEQALLSADSYRASSSGRD